MEVSLAIVTARGSSIGRALELTIKPYGSNFPFLGFLFPETNTHDSPECARGLPCLCTGWQLLFPE